MLTKNESIFCNNRLIEKSFDFYKTLKVERKEFAKIYRKILDRAKQ